MLFVRVLAQRTAMFEIFYIFFTVGQSPWYNKKNILTFKGVIYSACVPRHQWYLSIRVLLNKLGNVHFCLLMWDGVFYMPGPFLLALSVALLLQMNEQMGPLS